MEQTRPSRPVPGISRAEEEKQLKEVIAVAQENLKRTEGHVKDLTEELHDLIETYGPKDKEALSLLHNTQAQLRENQRDLLRSRKARQKPYFGRIDFRDLRMPWDESYYVGRVGIVKDGVEPMVIDWRAPVASVYYENSIGRCRYVVKNEGSYEIDLKRKRTYEIENDRLKDFFDSDVVANDELLTKYLAKNKKAVLGEIIATIQKEQNAIIRKSPKTNLIVQGVAGSGKTTVAMHRISYILYNYEEEFRPEDFYIIGSNRILLNYITSVLPDLDVYGVSQMTMEQLFTRLLYEDWDDRRFRIRPADHGDKASFQKGTYAWFQDLEAFCREYEEKEVPLGEVRMEKNGMVLVSEQTIRDYLGEHSTMSMQSKINGLNDLLLARLENEYSGKYVSYTEEEKKELRKTYRWHFGKNVWKGSIYELYWEFLEKQEAEGKKVSAHQEELDIYDLAALAYLYKRIKETDGIREASHVIIDEAQDFGMMAYGALAYCLRGCTYTIMGDVSQNIHFGYGLNDWEELKSLILTDPYDSFSLLKKSYRNTVEISDFAMGILRHGSFSVYPVDPINRHGSQVCILPCEDEDAMLRETEHTIRGWKEKGWDTIAVICRDEGEADWVKQKLGTRLPIADSSLETAEFGSGIMVLPVDYTKGLEFDAVLLYHPSETHYPTEDAYVKLLYVAATRALHELTVVHQKDLTNLIAQAVPEKKRMKSLEQIETEPEPETEMEQRDWQREAVLQGKMEQAMRGYIGPKPIVAKPIQEENPEDTDGKNNPVHMTGKKPSINVIGKKGTLHTAARRIVLTDVQQEDIPLNVSVHRFGDVPGTVLLKPKGHSRIDCSVRIVKKTKRYLDLFSSYGVLRLSPVEDGVVRVQFLRGQTANFEGGYWDFASGKEVAWTARAGKNLVEMTVGDLTVQIPKKTGELRFFDQTGHLLTAEKASLPRQLEEGERCQSWVYFDWQKKEKLQAKGILPEDLQSMNQKARYISFGGKKLRMPLVVSEHGYGIAAAAKGDVICCDIQNYGPYLYTQGERQIDYYFIYKKNYPSILEWYQAHRLK